MLEFLIHYSYCDIIYKNILNLVFALFAFSFAQFVSQCVHQNLFHYFVIVFYFNLLIINFFANKMRRIETIIIIITNTIRIIFASILVYEGINTTHIFLRKRFSTIRKLIFDSIKFLFVQKVIKCLNHTFRHSCSLERVLNKLQLIF
jgi:hypothetical protein